MAISLVGTPSVIVDGGSYTAEDGSDRLVVFSCTGDSSNGRTLTSVDMGAQAATLAVKQTVARQAPTGIFYIKEADIPTGLQTITVTFSGVMLGTQITCYTLSGVDQTTPVNTSGEDEGTIATMSVGPLGTDVGGYAVSSAGCAVGNATFDEAPDDTQGFTMYAEAEVVDGPKGSFARTTGGSDVTATYVDNVGSKSTVMATFSPAPPSAILSGTASRFINEADLVAGGKTIIATLTSDTFVAAGTGPVGTTALSAAILAAIDSAQSEANGFDATVSWSVTDLVRTSDTVITVTLPATATYAITAQEVITQTIPAAALVTSSVNLVATPSFTIDYTATYTHVGDVNIINAPDSTIVYEAATGGGGGEAAPIIHHLFKLMNQ